MHNRCNQWLRINAHSKNDFPFMGQIQQRINHMKFSWKLKGGRSPLLQTLEWYIADFP